VRGGGRRQIKKTEYDGIGETVLYKDKRLREEENKRIGRTWSKENEKRAKKKEISIVRERQVRKKSLTFKSVS
jgi:hypothetical protein